MAIAGIAGGTILGSLIAPALEPLTRALGYGLNTLLPTEIPNPNDLIDIHHRYGITTQQYYDFMKQHGYSIDNAKILYYACLLYTSPSPRD